MTPPNFKVQLFFASSERKHNEHNEIEKDWKEIILRIGVGEKAKAILCNVCRRSFKWKCAIRYTECKLSFLALNVSIDASDIQKVSSRRIRYLIFFCKIQIIRENFRFHSRSQNNFQFLLRNSMRLWRISEHSQFSILI